MYEEVDRNLWFVASLSLAMNYRGLENRCVCVPSSIDQPYDMLGVGSLAWSRLVG